MYLSDIGLVVLLVLAVLVVYTNWRFQEAYLHRYGGPTIEERWQQFKQHPLRVWAGQAMHPKSAHASPFRRVDDAEVERRRRQYLLVSALCLLTALAEILALVIGGN